MTTVIFFPTRATRSGERARFVGLFQGCTGLWTAGCWLARRLQKLKASTTMDLGISIFIISVQCMYVCVCLFSSHPFWTSSSLDVPAGVAQEESHTGFLIHLLSAVRGLIFLARRIQPCLSLVDREVEFGVLTIYSFSARWAFVFIFYFIFLVRKIPFAGIELTSQRVRRLHGYL